MTWIPFSSSGGGKAGGRGKGERVVKSCTGKTLGRDDKVFAGLKVLCLSSYNAGNHSD